jgi:Uma2 family endonuclease
VTTAPQHHPLLSEAEYLELEESSPLKHEYVDGEVFALAGATQRHNAIATNILVELALGARGSSCQARGSDQRLRIGAGERVVYYYPDVQLVCDPSDNEPNFVERPCLIVEIESEGTREIDHREKLMAYRALPSVQAYLIVSQTERRIERHFRDEHGAWWKTEGRGHASIPVPCTGGTLDLDAVYANVF